MDTQMRVISRLNIGVIIGSNAFTDFPRRISASINLWDIEEVHIESTSQ